MFPSALGSHQALIFFLPPSKTHHRLSSRRLFVCSFLLEAGHGKKIAFLENDVGCQDGWVKGQQVQYSWGPLQLALTWLPAPCAAASVEKVCFAPLSLFSLCVCVDAFTSRWWAWTLIKGLSPEEALQVRAKVASLEALKGQRADLGLQRAWEGNYLVSRWDGGK